jgi:crotonobetainyl-CoA:carnitine CoA-transferase CaiB-like acyl-CoA transferase
MMRPLEGVKVLDFSTLLPGPVCTLLMAEAGAEVIKVERPGGDEMRSYAPKFNTEDSVNFVLLNRGKKSVVADLKDPTTRARLDTLIAEADVLVEQFRPGVMARLGLGFDDVRRINPRIIYCSITGYGQTGPYASLAAHDLNYQAQTGMLYLSCDESGAPGIPPVLTADLAAGAYPAMINILLALRQRDHDGQARHIDVAMADNLFPLMYWALGNGWSAGLWPRPGGELVTGGSARYQIYRTADGRYLAAAPLEDKFWRNFLEVIGKPEWVDDTDGPDLRKRVARVIATQSVAHWCEQFNGKDCCVSEVVGVQEAVKDPHFEARGLFTHSVVAGGRAMHALPTVISPQFASANHELASPGLGEHTQEILG